MKQIAPLANAGKSPLIGLYCYSRTDNREFLKHYCRIEAEVAPGVVGIRQRKARLYLCADLYLAPLEPPHDVVIKRYVASFDELIKGAFFQTHRQMFEYWKDDVNTIIDPMMCELSRLGIYDPREDYASVPCADLPPRYYKYLALYRTGIEKPAGEQLN